MTDIRSLIRGGAHRRLRLAAVILLTLAIRLPGIESTLAGRDSWRQTDTATIARNFLEDPRILWPRVAWGAPGPGFVEAEFQLYPYATSLLYRLFGENPSYGRLLTLFVTGVACAVIYRIARRYFDDGLALVCVALFALQPIVFRYSYEFMPDPTALLFFLVALDRFLEFLDRDSWSSLISSAIPMALAILVKPTAIHLGLILCVLAVVRRGWGYLFGKKLIVFALVSLLPPIAYFSHAAAIYHDYGNTFGVLSGGDSKWGTLAWRLNPRFYRNITYADVLWTVGPAGAALSLIGLLRYRARGWPVLAASWTSVTFLYYLIVARYAGHLELGLHYHLYAAPLLALLTTGGIAAAKRARLKNRWIAPIALVCVFGYQLVFDLSLLRAPHDDIRLRAGRAVAEISRPEDLILVLSWDVSSVDGKPNNFEQPDVFFHSRRRGRVLARDRQSRAGIEASLAPGIKWFVNFPRLNVEADSSFHSFIHDQMELEIACNGFEIYSVTENDDTGGFVD